MSGIVIELQKEALDETVSIESLLRKAYLVAKKLKLKDFEEWINQEQNGYDGQLPEYRNVSGEIKAWNPYHGWIPVVLSTPGSDIFSRLPLDFSISVMADSYDSSNGTIYLGVNAAMTELLNNSTDFMPTKYSFVVSKSELYRIMSTVRNKILDWALLLEENEILGEGMTFTEKEKEIASNTQVINNYTNNFYSSASDVDIQQGFHA